MQVTRPGAFGLHLPGLKEAAKLLVQAPKDWPEWRIELANGAGRPAGIVDDSRAVLACEPSGWVSVDRARRTSRLHLPSPPSLQEIVQPRLGITAIMAAHWRGDHSFHAGAFIAGDVAWGVLGAREAGKSSLLATLAQIGVPVLADDLLIVDRQRQALAGPRCLDLRETTAHALDLGRSIGVIGTRERWRMTLDPVVCDVPLGGFVLLDWGALKISSVPTTERVQALTASFALRLQERSDSEDALQALMGVFALPMVQLRRPRQLNRLQGTAKRLLTALADIVRSG